MNKQNPLHVWMQKCNGTMKYVTFIFMQNDLAWFKVSFHGILPCFCNIPWTGIPVASSFSLVLSQAFEWCLFSQLTTTTVSCSLMLNNEILFSKCTSFRTKIVLWHIQIQKYPRRCPFFAPHIILSYLKNPNYKIHKCD